MKLSRLVLGSAVAVSLVGGGLLATPAAAQDECGVAISGGNVANDTSIFISANAGTSISDASAGSNNAAITNAGAESLDIASAGNGGVATSAANGGAVSTGNINSGGNVGNAISVGNTYCNVAPYEEVPAVEEAAPVAEAPAEVVALPATGVGVGEMNALFAVLASAGAAAASLGLRRR
ncbi:MAG: hypothetical protein IT338_16240 [Thermomicrobiales bacterium]|nr:hypothetical protein [Thermomicrobiales bacterium]